MMKKELKKKIESMCAELGTAAAAENVDELIEKLDEKFDQRVSEGKSELEAYRELLSDVDAIKAMLASMPGKDDEAEQADEEEERRERERNGRRMNALMGSFESAMWILIVIAYFALSFLTGKWHLTWLIFLMGANGSILFDMVRKYNRGKPLDKVIDGEFSGLMWVTITIIYFLYSFTAGGWAWAYSWMIFLVGALIEVLRDGIRKAKRQ